MLLVLGEPVDESVVLAGERDGRRFGVVRLEDLDHAPTAGSLRRIRTTTSAPAESTATARAARRAFRIARRDRRAKTAATTRARRSPAATPAPAAPAATRSAP